MGWRRSDQLDEFTVAALFGHERQDGAIHCRELSFLMHRKSQQIGIGHLSMARQSRTGEMSGTSDACTSDTCTSDAR
jgi:hypothetical protein